MTKLRGHKLVTTVPTKRTVLMGVLAGFDCAILAFTLVCVQPADAAAQGWNTIPQYNLGASQGPGVTTPRAIAPGTAGRVATSKGAAYPEFLPNCLNVTAFGAVADNTTDTAAALTAAYAALGSTGGCVYFPAGKYRFNSSVGTVLGSGSYSVRVTGDGDGTTILNWPNASGGLSFIYPGRDAAVHVSDLTLSTTQNGSGAGVTLSSSAPPADAAYAAQSTITRVTFRGDAGYLTTNTWSVGLDISGVSNVNVSDVQFSGGKVGASYGGSGTGIRIAGISPNYAVVLNVSSTIFDFTAFGILYSNYVQGVTCSACNFTGGDYGIVALAGTTGTLAQLGVTMSQFNVGSAGIYTAYPIGDMEIVGNLFIQPANAIGMNLAENVYFTILGNEFAGLSATGSKGVEVGNAVAGATGLISGNTFYGLGTAINLTAASHDNVVTFNGFANNTADVTDAGTNNVTMTAKSGAVTLNKPLTLTVPLAIGSGGTGCSAAAGGCLDAITGFSGTGFLTRTGAGTYAFQSATNGITFANIAQGSALSVLGVSGNATANVASIAAGADYNVMRRSGTSIGFGAIDLSQAGAVGTSRLALANLAQAGANTVLGNATGSTADVAAQAMPSCSTAGSALKWTSNAGFSCNTAIDAATLGGATFAAPGAIGGGTPAAGAFTALTGSTSTLTQATAANTAADGEVLANSAAATSGNQRFSPRMRFTGSGWKTDATAGAQTVDWTLENRPTQGTANPGTTLSLRSQINGGGYGERVGLAYDGANFIAGFDGASSSQFQLKAGGTAYGYHFVSAGGYTFGSLAAIPVNLQTNATTRVVLGGSGGLTLGATAATLADAELGITKVSASGTAPGAGFGKLAVVAGTNAGTCKLIMYAGTSTTPVTVIDNVGAGC